MGGRGCGIHKWWLKDQVTRPVSGSVCPVYSHVWTFSCVCVLPVLNGFRSCLTRCWALTRQQRQGDILAMMNDNRVTSSQDTSSFPRQVINLQRGHTAPCNSSTPRTPGWKKHTALHSWLWGVASTAQHTRPKTADWPLAVWLFTPLPQ